MSDRLLTRRENARGFAVWPMGTPDECLPDGLVIAKRYHRVTIPGRPQLPRPQAMTLPYSNILAYLRRPEPTIGRRELSVLLCGALFRAVGTTPR